LSLQGKEKKKGGGVRVLTQNAGGATPSATQISLKFCEKAEPKGWYLKARALEASERF
jgi:hypothetical protein